MMQSYCDSNCYYYSLINCSYSATATIELWLIILTKQLITMLTVITAGLLLIKHIITAITAKYNKLKD